MRDASDAFPRSVHARTRSARGRQIGWVSGNGVTSDEIRETRVRRGSSKFRRAHRRLNAIKPVEQQRQHRPTTIPSFLLLFSRFRFLLASSSRYHSPYLTSDFSFKQSGHVMSHMFKMNSNLLSVDSTTVLQFFIRSIGTAWNSSRKALAYFRKLGSYF